MSELRNKIVGGIIGLVVGDALGVPVEFHSRDDLKANPVTDMIGYGSHNQPPGTWSDDSSMALATLESLLAGYDPVDIMTRFDKWFTDGYMTPHGKVFDYGGTTSNAISSFALEGDIYTSGPSHEHSNGNGSLMRILPLSIYEARSANETIIARNFEASGLTHAHIRSKLCCAYYSFVVQGILAGRSLQESVSSAATLVRDHVPEPESNELVRLLNGSIIGAAEDEIRSSGYVVHTLEASLWCCHQHDNYRDAVLHAVNLGYDTDTTGAVAGGLAGVIYGFEAIPTKWVDALARKDDVLDLANRFADVVIERWGNE